MSTPAPTSAPTPTPTSTPAWSFNEADYANTATFTGLITIGGAVQTTGELAAFQGDTHVLRGLQDDPLAPPFGPYMGVPLYQMVMYANGGGEKITFKFKTSSGTIASIKQNITFTINGNTGDAMSPFMLTDVTTALH